MRRKYLSWNFLKKVLETMAERGDGDFFFWFIEHVLGIKKLYYFRRKIVLVQAFAEQNVTSEAFGAKKMGNNRDFPKNTRPTHNMLG